MNHLAQSLSLLYRIKLIFITGEIEFFSTLKNVCEKPGNIRRCFFALKRLTFQLNLADPLASVPRKLPSYDALAYLYLFTFY